MHRKASFKKHLSIKYFCRSKREADDENSMIDQSTAGENNFKKIIKNYLS